MKKERDVRKKKELEFNDSTPFRIQDREELFDIQRKFSWDKRYLKIMHDWKDNLRKKHSKKERSEALLDDYVKIIIF